MSRDARQYVGVQEIDVGSSQSVLVEPEEYGVSDNEWQCDISIQNTGSTTVWVRPDNTETTKGVRLKAGESIDLNNHSSDAGDLFVYYPDSAGGTVNCAFFE